MKIPVSGDKYPSQPKVEMHKFQRLKKNRDLHFQVYVKFLSKTPILDNFSAKSILGDRILKNEKDFF